MLTRVLVAICILPLLWLAQLAGERGIAALYADSAADMQEQIGKAKTQQLKQQWLTMGSERLQRSLATVPHDANYTLQAVALADARQLLGGSDDGDDSGAALLRENIGRITRALAANPARADLWSSLAYHYYSQQGASAATLQALERALYYAPRSYAPLLLNARIVFTASDALSTQQQVAAWSAVVRAARIEKISREMYQMARESRMERQLQVLIQEKEREETMQAHGGAG